MMTKKHRLLLGLGCALAACVSAPWLLSDASSRGGVGESGVTIVRGAHAGDKTSARDPLASLVGRLETSAATGRQVGSSGSDMRSILGASWTSRGYVIGSTPGRVALAAGLQEGDLITLIGERIASDPMRDGRIVDAARESGGIDVAGTRTGKPLTVSLAF